MVYRPKQIDEDIDDFLQALGLASGGSGEPFKVWYQGKNRILLPTARGLRAMGRSLFGVRPGPFDAFRRPMVMPSASIAQLEEVASQAVGAPASVAGFRIGSGGRRKLTVAFANQRGPLAIAQFPLVELAEHSLAHQEETLAFLRRYDELAGRLPEVISSVELGGERGTLLSPGPYGRVRNIDDDVISFLADLHRATSCRQTIAESGAERSWLTRLDSLRVLLGPNSSSVLERAIHLVRDRLRGIPIDQTIAHGDFTRWNVRRGTDGLFVFDWEASVRNALPYHDLFHFMAADSALLGRPSPKSRYRWRSLRDLAERISPAWVALQDPLYVAYLVETTLWYASSREWHLKGQSGPFWRFLWAELVDVTKAVPIKS